MIAEVRNHGKKIIFQLKVLLNSDQFFKPVEDFFNRGDAGRCDALLIYRTMPFHLEPSHPVFNFHQSMVQSLLIAEVLDQMGFRVDVIDHSRPVTTPRNSYDMVICHKSDADPHLPQFANSRKIYLASGTEHRTHNSRQRKRLEDFELRRGKHNVELVWDTEDMPWVEHSDRILCFGNEAVAGTWRSRFNCPVLPFQNTAVEQLTTQPRQWREAASHFLFLGSRQQLAKGLDLLLEAFADCPDLHLHVCGHYLKDPEFCKVYRDLLFNRKNIHSYGWVDITSRKFLKIAYRCGFTISASCAEGSPGSITNAMKLGMIPILSPEAGVDEGEGVIILNDISIAGIKCMIKQYSSESPRELQNLSDQASLRANRDFTEEAFKSRWFEMLTDALSNPPKSAGHTGPDAGYPLGRQPSTIHDHF